MTQDENGRVEPRLSAAAENALDEAIDDIKQEVTRRANLIANGPQGDSAVVGVRDVVQALAEVSSQDSRLRRRLRLVRIATFAYAVLGTNFALLYYLADLGSGSSTVLLMSGILIGSALGPLLLANLDFGPTLRKPTSQGGTSSRIEYDVLYEWARLESAIRARYSDQFGESRASIPIGRMIDDLGEIGVLRQRDLKMMKNFITLRNGIAHGRISLTSMGAGEARDLVRSARTIHDRLLER
ncbi:hypothetical protein GCM10010423_33480 [Streptomyces levis]|uniref:RiboL-PSP-HEPN domain-containing protein n=1 Tax=Streptomyces levis TaxID=285566 RepID=A0ABN3NUB7_9ACTN